MAICEHVLNHASTEYSHLDASWAALGVGKRRCCCLEVSSWLYLGKSLDNQGTDVYEACCLHSNLFGNPNPNPNPLPDLDSTK